MSLLEDALRRQSEALNGQAPAVAPPAALPAAADPPPTQTPVVAPSSPVVSPGAACHSLQKPWLPLLVLAVCLTIAWFALRRWEGRGPAAAPAPGEARPTQPPPAPVQPLSPPASSDPGAFATRSAGVAASPAPDAGERGGDHTDRERAAETHAGPGAGTAEAADPPTPAAAPPPVPAAPPEKTPWPRFAVKGIAYGQEKLVMLDTGEMLADGELSRTGVRVVRVAPDRAWFVWRNATNALRKGEASDKPLPD